MHVAALTTRNLQLTDELTLLMKDYVEAIDDNTVTHSKIIQLEKEAQSDVKHETKDVQQLQADFKDLVHENTTLNKKRVGFKPALLVKYCTLRDLAKTKVSDQGLCTHKCA